MAARSSQHARDIGLRESVADLEQAAGASLAAAGEAGVARAIEILREDVKRTLVLLGCPSVSALDSSYVRIPKDWAAN